MAKKKRDLILSNSDLKGKKILRGALIFLLLVLLIAAAMYVSGKLSSKQSVAPNAPESKPAAVGSVCEHGTKKCFGSMLQVCDANGLSYKMVNCSYGCSDGETHGSAYCNKQQNVAKKICVPNQLRCASSGSKYSVQICDSGGFSWKFVRNCLYGCSKGKCLRK